MPSANDPLNELNETLLSLPAAEVRVPNLPMAVFNQQGNDLVAFLKETAAAVTRLKTVGMPSSVLDALPTAIAGSQAAESAWQGVFSPRRPEDVIALEERADRLRSDVMAAARWNLREDRIAQGTLDAIADGMGSADLAEDLGALATLVENNEAAFAKDKTFDAKARTRECREQAKELRDAVSGVRADLTRAEAKDMRDRAYTYADGLVDQIREAARYAFRDEPQLLARFQDRYALERGRRFRRREPSVTGLVDA